MKVAVTYENGSVFQHFGHSKQFKLYDIENGKVLKSEVVNVLGGGHGALAAFLQSLSVEVLICGGIGGGARVALGQAGISLFPGVSGDADENVQAFIDGKLVYNPDTVCNHHHEDGHNCGSHSCGEDKHGCGGNH